MNERFFALPKEKQQTIINAGYRVFSQNTYKNSPMSEIAEAAGISKSLLFHYFYNKKELYLFLWDNCGNTTKEYLKKYDCYGQTDMFESMERGLKAKMELMRIFPYMSGFSIRAYYEEDPEISEAIHERYNLELFETRSLFQFDPEQFVPGLDIPMMIRDMYWASDGYLREMFQRGNVDVDQIEKDFRRLISLWKSVYLRKE
ncbi:MAG: TetR/AcrR family transcriptional regulator [Clostridiales bacterium]|nr:TetR/AcrR family transcriptional regulator [Clostridiales bacterium]